MVTGSTAEETTGTDVQTSPAPVPSEAASDPAMDLMPMIDVEGMGPFEAEAALNDAGILTVIHVDAAEAGDVAVRDEPDAHAEGLVSQISARPAKGDARRIHPSAAEQSRKAVC